MMLLMNAGLSGLSGQKASHADASLNVGADLAWKQGSSDMYLTGAFCGAVAPIAPTAESSAASQIAQLQGKAATKKWLARLAKAGVPQATLTLCFI